MKKKKKKKIQNKFIGLKDEKEYWVRELFDGFKSLDHKQTKIALKHINKLDERLIKVIEKSKIF